MRRLNFILVLAIALAGTVAALEVPYLGGRVNDLAGMIPADVEKRLEFSLEQLEKDTGAQVVVLTVATLEGAVLESFALEVAETWQLGRKEQDDGILLLVAKKERKIRIEVGYGLEGAVPDITAKRIIDGLMTPRFREGDFGGGVEAAAGALDGFVRGEVVELPEESETLSTGQEIMGMLVGSGIFLVVIGIFSVVALFTKGGQGWFLYVFLTIFYLVFPVGIFGPIGLIAPLLWIVGFPILRTMTWHSSWGRGFRKAHPGWVTFAASSGSGGGFGGGGGFSGGGGSFGGGGASGGW